MQIQIFPYSVFYMFFEQYLDIWRTALINIAIALGRCSKNCKSAFLGLFWFYITYFDLYLCFFILVQTLLFALSLSLSLCAHASVCVPLCACTCVCVRACVCPFNILELSLQSFLIPFRIAYISASIMKLSPAGIKETTITCDPSGYLYV